MSQNHRPGPRDETEVRSGVVDHADRAKARMAELRAAMGDGIMSADEDFKDEFFAQAPGGWVYNWKTHSVFNKEDPKYLADVQRNGWSPVPANRHMDLLYPGYTDDVIIVKGNMLMERPKELQDIRIKAQERQSRSFMQSEEAKIVNENPAGVSRSHPELQQRVSGRAGPVEIE